MNDYIDEARMMAAQCWCDKANSGKTMDHELAESFARLLANWMADAARHSRNEEWYRGLLMEFGSVLGDEVRRMGDGTLNDEPFPSKIPVEVKRLVGIHSPFVASKKSFVDNSHGD